MPKAKKAAPRPTSLVTFLLDRSGSMQACRAATIEAFNAYLGGLKAEPDAAISFTLLQFDSRGLDKCCVNVPVNDARDLTMATYVPRAGTPLIDAAVKTIRAVEGALASRDDHPRVVVCIQTDGAENESRDHSWEELRALVASKTEAGWEFNFMGTGIEGYDQATRMGIAAGNTVSYESGDLAATRAAFTASAFNAVEFSKGSVQSTAYTVSQRVGSKDKHFDKWIDPTMAAATQAIIDAAARRTVAPVAGRLPDFKL